MLDSTQATLVPQLLCAVPTEYSEDVGRVCHVCVKRKGLESSTVNMGVKCGIDTASGKAHVVLTQKQHSPGSNMA